MVPLIKIRTFSDTEFSPLRNFRGYKQGCTNPHRQVARETKFTTMSVFRMQLASHQLSRAWNFEAAPRFMKDLVTPVYKYYSLAACLGDPLWNLHGSTCVR